MSEAIGSGRRWASQLTLEALSVVIHRGVIERCLRETGREGERLRKLPAIGVVWLVIGMGLFAQDDLPAIWRQVVGTLATLWRVLAGVKAAGKSAISAARDRLGARVMRRLFVAVARPVADDQTRGAFYRGLRLMAMDGQKLCVPDTPANARAFGRSSTRRQGQVVEGAYPQLHLLRLIETGTHVSVEALIKVCRHNEYPVGAALLRRVPPGSLVMQDCGFYGYSQVKQAMGQGVHLLARVGARVVFKPLRVLADGSCLVRIHPKRKPKDPDQGGLLVRLIRYTIDDPDRPGHRQEHRMITTLLDDTQYPAHELIGLYHQRWECEIDNDELTTHQLARPVDLRSRKPAGVVQELYGIILAHNAIRMIMHAAARRRDIDPRELSFINSLRIIRETIPILRAAPIARVPLLYRAMLTLISQQRLPPRADRINPRVVKVKMSHYRKKQPDDHGTHVRPFHHTIVILK